MIFTAFEKRTTKKTITNSPWFIFHEISHVDFFTKWLSHVDKMQYVDTYSVYEKDYFKYN